MLTTELSSEPRTSDLISFERCLFWELTKRCNLACAHCISKCFHEQVPQELSAEDALTVVERCAEGDVSQIHLFGGEPTARADLPRILRRCDELGIATSFNTNATRLDAELLQTWAELRHRRPVWVSFEDIREEAGDAIRGTGSFRAATSGARALLEVSGEQGLIVAFTVNRPALTDLHPADILRHFADLGGRRVVFQDLAVPDDASPELSRLSLDGALWLEFLEKLFHPELEPAIPFTYKLKPLVVEYLNSRLGTSYPVVYNGCNALSTELRLLPNGTLLPCSAAVGWSGALKQYIEETPTLVERPLSELLKTAPYRCFDEHKIQRDVDPCMEPCRSCHLAFVRCNPCVYGRLMGQEHRIQACSWVREATQP